MNSVAIPNDHTGCCYNVQCNGTRAVQLFHEELQRNKTVLSVIGGGCSTATELVARNASIPVVRSTIFY